MVWFELRMMFNNRYAVKFEVYSIRSSSQMLSENALNPLTDKTLHINLEMVWAPVLPEWSIEVIVTWSCVLVGSYIQLIFKWNFVCLFGASYSILLTVWQYICIWLFFFWNSTESWSLYNVISFSFGSFSILYLPPPCGSFLSFLL